MDRTLPGRLSPRIPASRIALAAVVAACLFVAAVAYVMHHARPEGDVGASTAIHYAPAENLEHIDVALIDQARTSIDMAAYVLTDWAVIQALTRAADRGVAIHIYLDGGQFGSRDPKQPFLDLKMTPGVVIRTKPRGEPLMHFKSYQIDGRLLRTGSANFSPSGLKRQDNDLIVMNSPEAAEAFKRNFNRVFADGAVVG